MDKIKSIVQSERNKFAPFNLGDNVTIQLDHVKSIYDVVRPLGYLVPKKLTEVIAWAKRHNIHPRPITRIPKIKVEKYFINKIDSINFEGYNVVDPITEVSEVQNEIKLEDYFLIWANILRSNVLVIALEPKSTFGLVSYKEFEYLLKTGEYYPILRVVSE